MFQTVTKCLSVCFSNENRKCDIKYNLIQSILKNNNKTTNIINTDECDKYYKIKLSSKQIKKLYELNKKYSYDENSKEKIIELNKKSTEERFKEINNYKALDEYNFYSGKKW